MTQILTATEYEQMREEILKTGKVFRQSNNFESVIKVTHQLGKTYRREIQLRPGLKIAISDCQSKSTVGLEHRHDDSTPLVLAFRLSGYCRVWTEGIGDDYYYEKAGENYLFFVPGTKEIEETPGGERLKAIKIIVEPEVLRSFSCCNLDLLPTELKALIAKDSAPIFHKNVGGISPAMQQALQQIINCPYQGITKQIYLESKVLELIALQFAQLKESDRPISCSSCLQPGDIDRIHHAKNILEKNLEDPPSLLELARKVGINDYKLKRGFREVFGTTAFGYLQKVRMERAKNLLAEQMLSVGEVAQNVGYRSQSRFCDAFKRHFGVTPRAYRMSLNS